ncbi:MAG: hemolysin family protein [Candidatus Eisenbacteria bacterium]|nr:hemolysin family protein [Candidatus Eisenbacteria bacterium]
MTVLVVVGVILCAFFEGTEIALISLNKVKVRHMAESGDRRAKAIVRFIQDPRKFLGTTLVGANLSTVLASTLSTIWFIRHFGETGAVISTAIVTVILLVFGEAVPKVIGRERASTVSFRSIRILEFFHRLFFPVIALVSSMSERIVSPFSKGKKDERFLFTKKELQMLLSESESGDAVGSDKRKMLSGVFEFGETTLDEIMVPRTQIAGVEKGTSVKDALKIAQQAKHSRLPVYEETLDKILGVVHIFDLFVASSPNEAIDELARPVLFVPEAKKCDDLLKELQQTHGHMAIVLDEYGGTAGIVTVEDLVEELVGEIADEDEASRIAVRKLDESTYLVDAQLGIDDLNDSLGIAIPEGDYETLAGFILSELGRIPARGERIKVGRAFIEILRSDKRRIGTVRIRLKE